MKPALYFDKSKEIKLGDFVEYRSLLFFWSWKKGRISYLPGVSKPKKSMQNNGINYLGITGSDGTFTCKLIHPDINAIDKRVRFLSRTDNTPVINPMDMSNIPSLKTVMEDLNSIKLESSVAIFDDEKQKPVDVTSIFSGDFLMLAEEEWPTSNKKPMLPLLQVMVDELPVIPEKLKPFKAITIFIDDEHLPFDSSNGDGWLVRTYNSLENLIIKENPKKDSAVKRFQLNWIKEEADFPQLEDSQELVNLSELDKIDDPSEMYYDEYETVESTKVGGYPCIVQSSLEMKLDEFVIQIGTEDKANWMWGDSGIGYFGINDSGEWKMEWQCY